MFVDYSGCTGCNDFSKSELWQIRLPPARRGTQKSGKIAGKVNSPCYGVL